MTIPEDEAAAAAAAATAADQSNKEEEKNNMAPNETKAGEDKVPLKEGDAADPKVVVKDSAKLEMGGAMVAEDLYPALSKSELMKYATDPFWVRLRWILFALFWLAWVAMLVAAVGIIVMAPKCYSPEPKQWWQKEPVYSVDVKSFKDSDANGKGDLKGVESKIDYLVDLGIGSVWLSPIYTSPQKDNGYDISNFREIDPVFGSMQDFKDLVKALHDNDIKLIMDFVPNHSSDQHPWFQKSVKKEEPYTNYYVWKAGQRTRLPNNWKSVFGGSAWEFHNERQEFYLHQFLKEQPDLNVREPKVVEELEGILNFWLDLGVDGFRMDAVAHLFEDPEFRSEGEVRNRGKDYDSVDHKYTYNLPEVLDLLRRFRAVLDKKTAGDEYNPRIMMTEAYLPTDQVVKYYGENFTEHSGDIAHMPLNLGFIDAFARPSDVNPEKLKSVISEYLAALPSSHAWPNFNLGNHDKSRMATRLGHSLVDAMNMVMLLLPGTPITYYGEEIGMADNVLAVSNPREIRDRFRSPMQWNAQSHAGFTVGSTSWLTVSTDYAIVNVAAQTSAEESHLKVYKALTHIREQQSILFGSTQFYANNTVFAYNRVRKGNPGYLVVVNTGDEEVEADVSSLPNLPDSGNVHVRSHHTAEEVKADPGTVADSPDDPEAVSRKVIFAAIPLKPKEGLVVTFVPKMS